jgi:hypothetical protein
MGRYSSVQAYADTNQNMRSVPYEQAAGTNTTTGSSSAVVAGTKSTNVSVSLYIYQYCIHSLYFF